MKNQFKLNLNTIAALNGSRRVSQKATIISPFDEVSFMRNMNSLFQNDFIFSNGGSSEGFEEFAAIFYRQFVNFTSTNWEYSTNFLEALGLDKYEVDKLLIENGSAALFKMAGNYYLLPYTAYKYDVYDRPLNIKINSPTSKYLNDYEPIDFVIFDNDPTKWNIVVKNISWLQLAYHAACALYDNIYEGQTHYLKLNIPTIDPAGPNNATLLDDALKDRNSVISYSPKEATESYSALSNMPQNDVFSQWKQSLLPIDFRDRLNTLWDTYLNACQEVLKDLGIRVNMNSKKKERQIDSEIDVQQEISLSQREAMFNKRLFALRKCNQKWGTEWYIIKKDLFLELQESEEIKNEN